MQSEEREYLYLKGTEELGDIIDAIKGVESKEIILVVPRNTRCLLHPTNLEILKHEANKHRKKIYISTDDEKLISLAKSEGLEIFLEDFTYEEATKIVTDILPPSKIKPKIKIKEDIKPKATSRKKINYKKVVTLSLIIGFILFTVFLYTNNLTTSATIEISLKKQDLPFEEVVMLDPNVNNPDIDKAVLPAEFIEIVKNHTVKQQTSGLKTSKAKPTGKVMFVNEDRENSISIIQGTRIKSSKGYIYRTMERINLEPGASKEVYVVADNTGSDYEIDDLNEKFEIPGLIGTRWEKLIKVKLVEPIVTGEGSKIVTVDDINEGKIKLEKEIKEVILQELAIKYKDYIFPEGINLVEVKVTDISHSIGQVADEIILTGSGKVQVVGVKKDKLIEFVKDLISKNNLKENKENNVVELKIDKVKLLNMDIKSKTATVSISGQLTIQGSLNVKKLTQELAGKNLAEAQKIFNNYPVIEKAELIIKPFWANYLPLDISKINVKIK